MKVTKVEKLTDTKFLNLYDVTYSNGVKWTISSRRDVSDLMAVSGRMKADAVTIIPILKQKNKDFVVLIKEFRYSINKHVWAFPSGLVEDGEDAKVSAQRELGEEIGAFDILDIEPVTDVCLKSEGMTDETTIVFKAHIGELSIQNLQDNEKIKVVPVEVSKIPTFMKKVIKNGEVFSLVAAIYLPTLKQ